MPGRLASSEVSAAMQKQAAPLQGKHRWCASGVGAPYTFHRVR
jgi:hypothetical protein